MGSAAEFDEPFGVTVDTSNNVYVADFKNCTIRKITSAGVVTTIAGFPRTLGTNDGVGGAARFDFPAAITVDSAGNLYVADSANFTIRKLTPVGTNWVVSTIAGKARFAGYADGTNSDARFLDPDGIAVDVGGNLYVADGENHTLQKVAPVGTNWVVTTLTSSFSSPAGVTVDPATNIYVADLAGDVIVKVSFTGTSWVTTNIAGLFQSSGSTDGTGSAARFFEPNGIAIDTSGAIYVSDSENSTLRKLSPVGASWQVTTLAGSVGGQGAGRMARERTRSLICPAAWRWMPRGIFMWRIPATTPSGYARQRAW